MHVHARADEFAAATLLHLLGRLEVGIARLSLRLAAVVYSVALQRLLEVRLLIFEADARAAS